MTTTRLLTLTVLGAWLGACAGENEPATSDDPLTGGSSTPTAAATPPPGTTGAPAATPPPATASAPPTTTAAPTAAPAAGACDDVNYDPKCDLTPTTAGEEIKKGTACTEADPQCCWRSCGPQSIGWKTEQCVAGVYAEGDCQFPPAGDYSCYAIPDAIDATVPCGD